MYEDESIYSHKANFVFEFGHTTIRFFPGLGEFIISLCFKVVRGDFMFSGRFWGGLRDCRDKAFGFGSSCRRRSRVPIDHTNIRELKIVLWEKLF